MRIQFDFSLLRGRIIEKYGTCTALALHINMPRDALSARLNNKVSFKPDEILLLCSADVLDIPDVEIGRYFLRRKFDFSNLGKELK